MGHSVYATAVGVGTPEFVDLDPHSGIHTCRFFFIEHWLRLCERAQFSLPVFKISSFSVFV